MIKYINMAKKKTKKVNDDKPKKTEITKNKSLNLKTETRHSIKAVLFFVLALFLFMSALSIAGVAGEFTYKVLYYVFGVGYILLPVLFLLLGASYVKEGAPELATNKVLSSILFLFSGLGIIDIATSKDPGVWGGDSDGGVLGKVLSTPLVNLFDVYASIIFLGALLIISMIIMFDTRPDLANFFARIRSLFGGKKVDEEYEYEEEEVEDEEEEIEEDGNPKTHKIQIRIKKNMGQINNHKMLILHKQIHKIMMHQTRIPNHEQCLLIRHEINKRKNHS
jgi:hypothetical protein